MLSVENRHMKPQIIINLETWRPYRLPTHELPTGRQLRGRHFMVHQSTGLPTLIMKTYFDMFWRVKQCF